MKLELSIRGTPKGKPAHKSFARQTKDGRIVMLHYPSRKARDWEESIERQARDLLPPEPIDEPVAISALFRILRPQKHYGAKGLLPKYADTRHAQKPDLDNLLKTLDIFTKLGAWRDDRRIWCITAAKIWTQGDPGLDLEITTERPTWLQLLIDAAIALQDHPDMFKRELARRIFRFIYEVLPPQPIES